ncbi:DUF1905 domain-containing protein [Sphingorhabdus contaminans]|uniref:DUF1905 domain-containing protein n=1 Tax=Sphingorhabdus contaminans TaxID=1343899 RepID=A0A553WCA5_9SPHN|nr:DUF1905 domain-containing protein [Sphingorhabdus contaminans]TSB02321.1 DUF1905 domain-containing protein [Sphingorhabdus contaminans]
MTETHHITAKLWLWNSDKAAASWHFLTIEGEAAEAIHALALMRRLESGRRRGWGAMKVHVTIGETSWDTSIFPDKGSGGWLLPVKAAVRKAEELVAGDEVRVSVTL